MGETALFGIDRAALDEREAPVSGPRLPFSRGSVGLWPPFGHDLFDGVSDVEMLAAMRVMRSEPRIDRAFEIAPIEHLGPTLLGLEDGKGQGFTLEQIPVVEAGLASVVVTVQLQWPQDRPADVVGNGRPHP